MECEIGTAVEPFREKNNKVKPVCHKINQGRYYLLIFSSFSKYLFSAAILSIKETLSVSIGTRIGQFRSFEFSLKSLRAIEWSENAKIA